MVQRSTKFTNKKFEIFIKISKKLFEILVKKNQS